LNETVRILTRNSASYLPQTSVIRLSPWQSLLLTCIIRSLI